MLNKSKRLPSTPWMRPTTSKVREALMSTLCAELEGARVLDMFAGTGSLGLAALKAGAQEVVFVECDRRSLKYLNEECQGQGSVLAGKLPQALQRLKGSFDIILADPPYNCAEGPATLEECLPFLVPGGIVVFEHHHKEAYPDDTAQLTLIKRKRYGETALSYWQKNTDSDSDTVPPHGSDLSTDRPERGEEL